VSPVFDVADFLMLIDLEGGCEVRRERWMLLDSGPFDRANQIKGFGVDVLICGAVSKALESAMSGMGIDVLSFICGDIETVISAFIKGRLSSDRFLMPGRRKSRSIDCSGVGRLAEFRPNEWDSKNNKGV
jgi:predicted Fe-Mo cluster-binding NifX family protein